MNCRMGCMILAILFAMFFVFGGMLCRIALPISPEGPASQSAPPSQVVSLELDGVPDVVN